MTERQRVAINYIESQLEYGYIDLGGYEKCELEIVKEAINIWKIVNKWNDVGCTSFQMTSDELKEIWSRLIWKEKAYFNLPE